MSSDQWVAGHTAPIGLGDAAPVAAPRPSMPWVLGPPPTPAAALLSLTMARSSVSAIPMVASPDAGPVAATAGVFAQAPGPVSQPPAAAAAPSAVGNDDFCYACRGGSSLGLIPELALVACARCSLSFHRGCRYKTWVEPPTDMNTPWTCQLCVNETSRSPASLENSKRLVQSSVRSRGFCPTCGLPYETVLGHSQSHECRPSPLALQLAKVLVASDIRVRKRPELDAVARSSLAETDADGDAQSGPIASVPVMSKPLSKLWANWRRSASKEAPSL